LESNYCRNPTPDTSNTIFCYTTDSDTSVEDCEPLKEWQIWDPVLNIRVDPHMINIPNTDGKAIANHDDSTGLNINIKDDFNERQIYLEATTKGGQKIKKEIFLGVKKSCKFNVPATTVEFVFDHGYAGDTYGLNNVVSVMSATTSHIDVDGTATPHMNWSDPCIIDTIIFERFSDSNKLFNRTQTLKY
jgi:hypothetical protein